MNDVLAKPTIISKSTKGMEKKRMPKHTVSISKSTNDGIRKWNDSQSKQEVEKSLDKYLKKVNKKSMKSVVQSSMGSPYMKQKREWGEPPMAALETARTLDIAEMTSTYVKSVKQRGSKSTVRTVSWIGQEQQPVVAAGQRRTQYPPLTGAHPHRINHGFTTLLVDNSNNDSNNNINKTSNSVHLHNSSSMGSAGISSAMLGHGASPYQANVHGNAYVGQHFARPQNFHGSFQQHMCNGYVSTNTSQSRNGPRSSGFSTRRNSTGSPVASLSMTNVYIRGLEQSTTDEDLRRMCAKFGRIASTKAIMDKTTGQCKRYGFVDFEEAVDAQRAVEGLNQEGKVQAQMAKAMSPNNQNSVFQQQEQDPTNLYLANLPPDYTEKDLQKLLERYGSTISTRVLKNGDGSSRCVGFARMDNEELCAKIIRDMNGKKVIPGYNLPLMVKYADSNKKTKCRTLQNISGLYKSLPHLEIAHPCYATPAYDHSGQYIRGNPNLQYLMAAPSPFVYSPNPPYHVFSGYGDIPMGNLAAQMQNLSIHSANAMLQPHTDLANMGPGTSMTANQAPNNPGLPQVAVQTYATIPFYPWPYSVQTADPMIGAVVTSTAPLQNYVPELAAIHADAASAAAVAAAATAAVVPTNQTSGQVIYATHPQPLPSMQQN